MKKAAIPTTGKRTVFQVILVCGISILYAHTNNVAKWEIAIIYVTLHQPKIKAVA
jgi:hypothetical protein